MNRRRVFLLGAIVGLVAGAAGRNYAEQWIADYHFALAEIRREQAGHSVKV